MKQILYSLLVLLLLCFARANAQDVTHIADQKPVTIQGTFGIGVGTYSSSGIDPREHSFNYLFSGTPILTIYGVSFPFSIVVSDQQRGFRQPFNQYGISPTYKWVTVHAGWQSIQWSPFTLAGYNFLGGGVELNPGKLRLGFIYGRFNKAIEETSTQPLSFQTPSYQRMGYSMKLGYGTERNHLDITVLNAKDDSASLKNTVITPGLTPAANLVLGISSKWSFLKHFVWDFDIAGSIYTRNLRDDTLKNLRLDKVDFIRNFITINSSSQLLTAAQTNLGYQDKNYSVGIQYRRIDPDYKSMGAYYFETDVANYTVQGTVALLQGQLQLNGSLGLQNDNLLHDLQYTSHRTITSLAVSFNKPQYGVDVHFSNYGITQDRGLNPVIDTFRVARTNYNVSTVLRYTLTAEKLSHNFLLVGSIQSLSDLNHFTSAQNETNSETGNLSYQLSFNKSAFSINTTYNYTVADLPSMHTILYGPSLGFTKQLDKGKLGLNAAFSYQQQQNNNKSAGNIFNGSFNGSYRFSNRDAANITFIYLKSNSTDVTLPSFNEVRSSLNLSHSF